MKITETWKIVYTTTEKAKEMYEADKEAFDNPTFKEYIDSCIHVFDDDIQLLHDYGIYKEEIFIDEEIEDELRQTQGYD